GRPTSRHPEGALLGAPAQLPWPGGRGRRVGQGGRGDPPHSLRVHRFVPGRHQAGARRHHPGLALHRAVRPGAGRRAGARGGRLHPPRAAPELRGPRDGRARAARGVRHHPGSRRRPAGDRAGGRALHLQRAGAGQRGAPPGPPPFRSPVRRARRPAHGVRGLAVFARRRDGPLHRRRGPGAGGHSRHHLGRAGADARARPRHHHHLRRGDVGQRGVDRPRHAGAGRRCLHHLRRGLLRPLADARHRHPGARRHDLVPHHEAPPPRLHRKERRRRGCRGARPHRRQRGPGLRGRQARLQDDRLPQPQAL
ncbi:MAG: Agmatinase, partial [uncultured Gemmatimonadetes bacterium]